MMSFHLESSFIVLERHWYMDVYNLWEGNARAMQGYQSRIKIIYARSNKNFEGELAIRNESFLYIIN